MYDPFHGAELAAEETINEVLTRGGKQLFESYIRRKAYPFAAETISQLLVSELKMCFVRCDQGEPQRDVGLPAEEEGADGARQEVAGEDDGWSMEPEPARCRIDTWARAVVPIRRRPAAPKKDGAEDSRRGKLRAPLQGSAPLSSRTASRQSSGLLNSMQGFDEPRGNSAKPQMMIPLSSESEEDPEEAALREMKERELKRKAEEEARARRKQAEEAQQEAVVKEVQEAPTHVQRVVQDERRKPLETKITMVKEKEPPASKEHQKEGGQTARRRQIHKEEPKVPKFTDGFQKFAGQQPPLMETMAMAPGVQLTERGRKKASGAPTDKKPGTMTRREYEDFMKSGRGGAGYPYGSEASKAGAAPAPATPTAESSQGPRRWPEQPEEGSQVVEPADQARPAPQVPALQMVRASAGVDVVARPPASPRPMQPAPPPSAHRAQMKNAANVPSSTRERGMSSRIPGGPPTVPPGAKMGFGPGKSGAQTDDLYFPSVRPQNALWSDASVREGPRSARASSLRPEAVEEERVSVFGAPSTAPVAALKEGRLKSANPDLLRRLFPN